MKRAAFLFAFVFAGLCVYAQTGVIAEVSGTVELKRPGSSSYVSARAGDAVSQDTVVSTGFRSTALVRVGSSVITVRPLTRLTLTEISASAGLETLNVSLRTGRVRVDVNPPAGARAATSVTSPIATASVRGTSFEFDTRNLKVNQGTVSFSGGRGSPMLVGEGSSTWVETSGRVIDPVEVKKSGLSSPPPVGADASGGSGSATTPSQGTIRLELIYAE